MSSRNLDYALQWNAETFARHVQVSFSKKTVTIPRVFTVLRQEFPKADAEFLEWCAVLRHAVHLMAHSALL